MARRRYVAQPAAQQSVSPLQAIMAAIQEDDASRNAERERINNIRALQMELIKSLQSSGLRGRALDLQELRMMNQ